MKQDDDDIQDYVRPWVGLTDDEYINLLIQAAKPMKTAPDMAVAFGRLVEAKLKERNS